MKLASSTQLREKHKTKKKKKKVKYMDILILYKKKLYINV